jgi:hypothetical protein
MYHLCLHFQRVANVTVLVFKTVLCSGLWVGIFVSLMFAMICAWGFTMLSNIHVSCLHSWAPGIDADADGGTGISASEVRYRRIPVTRLGLLILVPGFFVHSDYLTQYRTDRMTDFMKVGNWKVVSDRPGTSKLQVVERDTPCASIYIHSCLWC